MTHEYSEACLRMFLKKQGQLFDEIIADDLESADDLLGDCWGQIADSLEEVRDYFEANGMDVSGMTLEEISKMPEVFDLEDGTWLVVSA